MQQYHALLNKLLIKAKNQKRRENRTDTKTISLFGEQMRFDLQQGFPLLTTKKVNFHAIVHELLWFLSGDTNIKYLLDNDVHIWTEWAYEKYVAQLSIHDEVALTMSEFEQEILNDELFASEFGELGPIYGHQWRSFGEAWGYDDQSEEYYLATSGFDQITWVQNEIKTNPTSRRLIVNGWNPHDAQKVKLPPCHTAHQYFVEDGKLSLWLYSRKLNHCALTA